MKMPFGDASSLWQGLSAGEDPAGRFLSGAANHVRLSDLAAGSSLGGEIDALRGRSVLLATRDQLATAVAMIELDGIARRLVLCPADLPPAQVAAIMRTAAVNAVVSDGAEPPHAVPLFVTSTPKIVPAAVARGTGRRTEWILLTSGTTGVPKLVVHDFASLAGPARAPLGRSSVWSTFYDIRRYGGLAMFFRALLGGGSMVLSSAEEETGNFLNRAAARAVTHISGTPSHWRRALMSPAARGFAPRYVRLSGEIADQAILDRLRAFHPGAGIAHAFASTEAGLAFEVDDGRAGFPASLIGGVDGDVRLRVADGSLRISSSRKASGYLGGEALADGDGFVDTGDLVELRGERYHFVGRRDGIINVGGLKVHPEEVEAVMNAHPGVLMSRAKARRSPITGAVVVADVVASAGVTPVAALEGEILEACRRVLLRHKVPAAIRFVSALSMTPAGKLSRHDA